MMPSSNIECNASVTVLAAVNTVAFASHLRPFFELSHARHHFIYMFLELSSGCTYEVHAYSIVPCKGAPIGGGFELIHTWFG